MVFDDIKAYLTTPLALASPMKGKPFVLYITALNHSLYYLNRTLVGLEAKYALIEKVRLALIFAKQGHYLQLHHMRLISKVDSLKYILN